MGSINRKSSPPPVQQFISAPLPPAAPVVDVPTDAEVATKNRTQSLLRRSRGRLGTIVSGFRGFLNPIENDSGASRKTLLGE